MKYWDLENLGRERLSKNFFMREFLYSEVANFYRISNYPVYPDIAIECGRRLCQEILEPLQDHYGRLHIRSGYRSPTLNEFCSNKGLGCKSNEKNYARHIWDHRDADGCLGAMAVVVIPSYVEEYERTHDHRPVSDWISQNINYSELIFFKRLCAFNIGWREDLLVCRRNSSSN
jgi:hypothetical protein